MPLVYKEATIRRDEITSNPTLKEIEISGFVKCLARKACTHEDNPTAQTVVLRNSLKKQVEDWDQISANDLVEVEALADIRNVAGILALALIKRKDG